MSSEAKRIEQEIQRLALDDLLTLDRSLVSSIHKREDALDPEFREEIQRRVREIDSGDVEGVDAFKALKEM